MPVGTVTWSANTGCAASAVSASGSATCATSSLVTPADVVKASYTGDTNYIVSSPGQITETVNSSSAAAVVTPAANPSSPSVNQSVTFSAQVWAPASEGGHGAAVQPKGSVHTLPAGGGGGGGRHGLQPRRPAILMIRILKPHRDSPPPHKVYLAPASHRAIPGGGGGKKKKSPDPPHSPAQTPSPARISTAGPPRPGEIPP